MPEFCSCGAQLPPDALFCHKCGKPQRQLVYPEPDILPPEISIGTPPPPPPRPEAPPLSFRNPVALRIAILVAIGATCLSFLPYLNWLAAGYFAAFLYRRRTGSALNVVLGVRMGWITGILIFVITALLFTGFVVLINASGGVEQLQSQFRNLSDPRVQEMFRLLRNRSDVVLLLGQLFVFITCLSMAGGALAAKLVR